MSGLRIVSHSFNTYTGQLPLNCLPNPLSDLPSLSSLIDRVSTNWKVLLMDTSTILAATACVITFLMGHSFIWPAFLFTAAASGVAAFYMRRFATLQELERAIQELKETKERFEEIAKNLEGQNLQLAESNRQLQQNNAVFQQNNAMLQRQVTQLSLQVTQLRESAQKIRTEVARFGQENNLLHANVRGFNDNLRALDQQIINSRALCEQIAGHLSSHEVGLGRQLEQLERYLAELRADNRVSERIQELGNLQQQITQAANQLHTVQLQYATERANFEAIHGALVQLKNQFDLAIRDAAGNLQANNQQFRSNISALSAERQRIHDLLNRHFATATRH
jgi:chromosome segregation ATPase